MHAQWLTPILNVSDMAQSFAWFEKLGWQKKWEWGTPPTFGAVGSGPCEIFLCLDGQGGRGKSALSTTAGLSESADKGVWMSIWVDDVDTVYRDCLAQGIEVTYPPTDEPWDVREMHVRHPDGHVFRIGKGIGEPEEWVPPREPRLEIERVNVPVRLETRIAAVLADLAAHKRMTLDECLEETLLHTFDRLGSGGVPSPHTEKQLDYLQTLKVKHGMDYDSHASYRFVEKR